MDNDDPEWVDLVLWLKSKGMKDDLLVTSECVPGAGRGLFAVKDVPPNTPLFTIPKSANMNITTLRPLYTEIVSEKTLTATQLISMHIFLHHPGIEFEEEESCDPTFGPYISIMPRDFSGHPFSWRIDSPRKNAAGVNLLQQYFPPGVSRSLDAMENRFWEDWRSVSDALKNRSNVASSTRRPDISFSPFVPELHLTKFLWAWLIVNTRCVFSHICTSPSDADNITLCPMLDLANHSSSPTFQPQSGPIPTFFSPSNRGLKAGEEVYLRYGSHSNSTLFAEYGFIEAHQESGGEADVQDIVEMSFQEMGPLGKWMETTLIDANYWGDWKLYEKPSPAHSSYRILPALRLLGLSQKSTSEVGASLENTPELELWKKSLLGEVDIVSTDNEKFVWQILRNICGLSIQRAQDKYRSLQMEIQERRFTGSIKYAAQAILGLWLEEMRVSRAVRQNIMSREI